MVARVVGKTGGYPLSISLELRQICDKCKRKGVRSVRCACALTLYLNKSLKYDCVARHPLLMCFSRFCTDFLAFDLAELVTNPPAKWAGLVTLGAVMARDLAALHHHGLAQIREKFDFVQPVASGTYQPPIEASLLLVPSNLLHLTSPPKTEVSLALPLDLSSFIQPGDRLAVMQTTMIKQFNKVVIQPWAEPGTPLGQVVQTFLEMVEEDKVMQDRCRRNPPVLRPRPGLLVVARSGEGVNRRWCRAQVGDNVLIRKVLQGVLFTGVSIISKKLVFYKG